MAPTVHAGCVVLGEAGVLVRGPSGSGKSALAAALVARWRAAGAFAAIVADDRVVLEAAGGRLIARAPAPLAGLMEIAGRGIVTVAAAEAAVVRLVLDLVPAAELARMPEADQVSIHLQGVSLARQPVPAQAIERAAALAEAALAPLGHLLPTGHVRGDSPGLLPTGKADRR